VRAFSVILIRVCAKTREIGDSAKWNHWGSVKSKGVNTTYSGMEGLV